MGEFLNKRDSAKSKFRAGNANPVVAFSIRNIFEEKKKHAKADPELELLERGKLEI